MKPTYRVLNKTLTIAGVDRRGFICGLMIGAGFFFVLGSFVVGAATFGFFYFLAWQQAKDPVKLRLLFNSGKYQPHYDAALHDPFLLIQRRSATP